jgi:hypothetical protein
MGALELKNDETRAWMDAACADFSRCLFLVQGVERTKEAAGEEQKGGGDEEPPVKSISIDGKWIDFNGLIFPGGADFASAVFSGFADFRSATFMGNAQLQSATFSRSVLF